MLKRTRVVAIVMVALFALMFFHPIITFAAPANPVTRVEVIGHGTQNGKDVVLISVTGYGQVQKATIGGKKCTYSSTPVGRPIVTGFTYRLVAPDHKAGRRRVIFSIKSSVRPWNVRSVTDSIVF